jgi:hypothetical protein
MNIMLLGVPKRKHVAGEWRKLLHNLYLSPGHVVRMGHWEKCTKFWWGSPKEGDHSEGQGIEGRMGSEWILGRPAGG